MEGRVNMKDLKGKYVHCETLEQAEELMEEAKKQGFIPISSSLLQKYYENTVYNFSKLNKVVLYGDRNFYENQGREVVEFRDMSGEDSVTEDIESLILTYLDSLPENELLKEKLRLSKMILNYKEQK